MAGTAVGQIIAVDDCDDDMLQAHPLDGRGKLLGLIRIRRLRIAKCFDAAKSTAARALFSGDHERGRAARPAVIQIRAASFLAHRMKPVVRDCVMR